MKNPRTRSEAEGKIGVNRLTQVGDVPILELNYCFLLNLYIFSSETLQNPIVFLMPSLIKLIPNINVNLSEQER